MNNSIIEFPVNVSQSEEGGYVARLVDLPEGADGPEGRGVDPYAALEDLTGPAKQALAKLYHSDALPEASPVDDRPVFCFDSAEIGPSLQSRHALATGKGDQSEMLGYSWTNHIVFADK